MKTHFVEYVVTHAALAAMNEDQLNEFRRHDWRKVKAGFRRWVEAPLSVDKIVEDVEDAAPPS